MSRKKVSLEETLAAINKKFGKGTIMPVSEAKSLNYIRIPTGIFSLDVAVGAGYGLPRGRVSLIIGEKSTGKTTICMKTIATWQKYCRFCNTEIKDRIIEIEPKEEIKPEVKEEVKPAVKGGKNTPEPVKGKKPPEPPKGKKPPEPPKEEKKKVQKIVTKCECGKNKRMVCVYLDGEGTYDPLWASHHGVDNTSVIMLQPEFAEQCADVVEELIRTGDVDLIIVDSIAALVPASEIEASAEDQQMGTHAKMVNRMCLEGNQRVINELTGELIRVKDLKAGVTLTSVGEDNKIRKNVVTEVFKTGRKDCLRINNTLVLTKDHLVFTDSGWVEAGKLTRNHLIARPKNLPVFTTGTSDFFNVEARLLGYALSAEGNPEAWKRGGKHEVEDKRRAIEFFGERLPLLTFEDYSQILSLDLGKAPHLRRYRDLFIKHNLSKETLGIIPKAIFGGDITQIKNFIEAMWTGGGLVNPTEKTLTYLTVSETLAYQLRHLLLRFGVWASLGVSEFSSRSYPYGKRYLLTVAGKQNVKRFYEAFSLLDEKQDRLKRIVERWKNQSELPIPAQEQCTKKEVETLIALLKKKKISGTDVCCFIGLCRNAYPEHKVYTYEILKNLVVKFGLQELIPMLESDLWYEPIINIEEYGTEEVYDISMKNEENFLCEEYVVHNCRALSSSMNSLGIECETKPHVILINQKRDKLGFFGGTTIPGGKGQWYTAGIIVDMRTPHKIGENGKLDPKQDSSDYYKTVETVGSLHNFEVVKNKTYIPFKRGSFRIYGQTCNNESLSVRKGEINTEEQILRVGLNTGAILLRGTSYVFQDVIFGIGKEKALQALKSNPELQEKIKVVILENIKSELASSRDLFEANQDMPDGIDSLSFELMSEEPTEDSGE